MATDLMFIKLIKPVDALQNEFPILRMYVVADDVRLGFQHQGEDKLATLTAAATKRALQLLEEEEHWRYPREKRERPSRWHPPPS